MKQNHSEEIERRKTRLSVRLSRRSRAAKGRSMFAGGNERFEMSRRTTATAFGGIGLLHRLVRQVGLPGLIDEALVHESVAVRVPRGRPWPI